jgi:hypothetical protein
MTFMQASVCARTYSHMVNERARAREWGKIIRTYLLKRR